VVDLTSVSRARVLVLAAGAVIALLLGAFAGGSGEGASDAVAPATSTTAVPDGAPGCPSGADCPARPVDGTTKTTVIVTAAAGGLALLWCRRRAKHLAAA
jgi:hypothetical protein